MHGEQLIPDGYENKVAKVIFKSELDGRFRTFYGLVTEDSKSIYVKLPRGDKIIVKKRSLKFLGWDKDTHQRSQRKTNRQHRHNRDKFSYSKWWSRENVEEADK